MESLATGGPLGDPEDRAPCLDMEPGQCARSPVLLSRSRGWRAVKSQQIQLKCLKVVLFEPLAKGLSLETVEDCNVTPRPRAEVERTGC